MRLIVAAVGERMPRWVDEGFAEYAKRFPPKARLELVAVRPESRGATRTVAQALADGRDVAFLVGGPDGLDPALKAAAEVQLRLSSLTLPHALVRVLLAEQLYRALTILDNHPYHRA